MSHNLDLLHAAQLTLRGWRFRSDVIATLAAGGYPRGLAPQVPDVPA
jgi:hypothetical protein